MEPPISLRARGVLAIRKVVKRCIEVQFDFLTAIRLVNEDSGKQIREILSTQEFVSFALGESVSVKKETSADIMNYNITPSKPLQETLSKKFFSWVYELPVSILEGKCSGKKDYYNAGAIPSKPIKPQTALPRRPGSLSKKPYSVALQERLSVLKEKRLDKMDYNCDALPSKAIKRPQTALPEILPKKSVSWAIEEPVSVPKENCSDEMDYNCDAQPSSKPVKRPQTAYAVYCEMTRSYLKRQNPKLSYKQITQKLKTEWNRLPPDEKEWCNDSATRNKGRWAYENAILRYNQSMLAKK